jgi:hypothetical protein
MKKKPYLKKNEVFLLSPNFKPALLFADLCDLKIFLKMFLKSPNRAEDAGFFLAPLTKHMDKLFQN